jgi:predicted histone-like DNA-binding protein
MTIKYKVGRAHFGDEDKAYPKLVPGETVTDEQFQELVAKRAARGMADVVAVLTALREVLLEQLLDEQSVHVPGVGYFTLSIKGELDEDERLVPESAKIRINYRAEGAIMDDVNDDSRFEFVGE